MSTTCALDSLHPCRRTRIRNDHGDCVRQGEKAQWCNTHILSLSLSLSLSLFLAFSLFLLSPPALTMARHCYDACLFTSHIGTFFLSSFGMFLSSPFVTHVPFSSVLVSLCLSVFMSLYLSLVHLPLSRLLLNTLSIPLSRCLSIPLSRSPTFISLSLCLSVSLSVCLSLTLSVSLSLSARQLTPTFLHFMIVDAWRHRCLLCVPGHGSPAGVTALHRCPPAAALRLLCCSCCVDSLKSQASSILSPILSSLYISLHLFIMTFWSGTLHMWLYLAHLIAFSVYR